MKITSNNYILGFAFLLLLATSCIKDEGALTGMEDFKNHPILWKNNFNPEFSEGSYVAPVLDKNDNIYLVLNHKMIDCTHDTNRLQVVSYDKNGNFRWKREKWRMKIKTLIPYNGRVYCLFKTEKDSKMRLLIFDADNGNTIVEKVYPENRFDMKISNERIYTLGYKMICAYDMEGEEIWSKWLGKQSSHLVVDGDELCTSYSSYGMEKYKDMGDYCELVWSWEPNKNSSQNKDTIDLENALVFWHNSQLNFVSKESGQTVHIIKSPKHMNYQQIVKDKGFLFIGENVIQMYDLQGQFLWEIENEHYYKENNFISIVNNDKIYWGDLYGLYVANSSGEMLWKLGLNQDITNLIAIVMNSESDLICHSPMGGKIFCIKGDGLSLD